METLIKSKGLKEILKESSSLSQEITYDEYIKGATIPSNSDESLKDAYDNYKKLKYMQSEGK